MEEEIAVVHEKIKILKIKQQADIGNKSQSQKKLPASSMLHGRADALIDKQAAH